MDRVNELRQAALDAAADVRAQENSLNALLDAESAAKSKYAGLLKQQAAGALAEGDQTKLAEAEAHVAGFPARLSAQRKLVAVAKDTLAAAEQARDAEQARLDAEDKALAAKPSGRVPRVEVGSSNAAKDPKRGFENQSDFMRSVMRAGLGMGVDERLKPLATQGSDEQQGASNPYGGFLQPVGLIPGVLSLKPEADPFEGLVTRIPMSAPTVKFNARVDKNHSTSVSGGFRWYRHAETRDVDPSRQQFEQITLTANDEMGAVFASENIISDSPESFLAIIQAGMADEAVAFRMNERINGTGVGQRQGALHTPCKIEVAKEDGQEAATIVVENIDNMAARCWRYGSAIYLANHTTRPQLRGLVRNVGTGGVPVPYFSTSMEGQEFLDGRPIFFTEFCPAVGTVGDLLLIVPSEYLEGVYGGEQFAESIHVRFLANERAFRFFRRTDGQWWWRSALTPKNGSTLSPVVTLATRS